tara:strand:+ start:2118 stop:2318 length:201 start_codon:yes stop_codon:yes gene_type:complete
MQIINVNNERYTPITVLRPPDGVDHNQWIEEIKGRYTLVDSVLKLGHDFYFCMKLIDAEYEEINNG